MPLIVPSSIPRSNEALALFELGSLPEAEKVARKLIRRDPNFKDGFALLAALRYAQGDTGGAAALVNDLCAGASGLCARYAGRQHCARAVVAKGGRDVSQAADGAVNTARAEEWARVAFSQNTYYACHMAAPRTRAASTTARLVRLVHSIDWPLQSFLLRLQRRDFQCLRLLLLRLLLGRLSRLRLRPVLLVLPRHIGDAACQSAPRINNPLPN